jgi:hypothetical protein
MRLLSFRLVPFPSPFHTSCICAAILRSFQVSCSLILFPVYFMLAVRPTYSDVNPAYPRLCNPCPQAPRPAHPVSLDRTAAHQVPPYVRKSHCIELLICMCFNMLCRSHLRDKYLAVEFGNFGNPSFQGAIGCI